MRPSAKTPRTRPRWGSCWPACALIGERPAQDDDQPRGSCSLPAGPPARTTHMNPAVPSENTTGAIARRLGEPLHRVAYVIRSRNIQPARRAGCLRLFSEDQVAHIAAELVEIGHRRGAP